MPPLQATRFLDQLREHVRYLHYSLRTEEAYVYWVRAFIVAGIYPFSRPTPPAGNA